MGYTPNYTSGWHDEPAEDTPITAAALNHIEAGLTAAAAAADSAATTAAAAATTSQVSTAQATAIASAGRLLIPTAVKTGAYTALPGDLVLVDASGGSVTITAPAAAPDHAAFGVKVVAIAGTNTVTIARSNADTFNGAGSTSLTLQLLNQGVTASYQLAAAAWWVTGDDLPLSRLDARYAALSGAVFTAAVAMTPFTLTDAATILVDATKGNQFRVVLGGNRILANPTGALDGQLMTYELIQDGTGGRTLTLDTNYKFGTDLTSITLSTTPGASDFLGTQYKASTGKFRVLSFVRGY